MKEILKKINSISKKKKIVILSSLVAAVVLIVSITLIYNYNHDKKIKEMSNIDFNSETYKGKEITVKGNQIIIQEENGSQTIETIGNANEMKAASESIKKEFAIDGVSISTKAAKTVITGTLTSKSKDYKNVVVTINFLKNGNKAGTSSTIVSDVKKNKTNNFEITILGNYEDCTYDIDVEYVK